MEGGVFEGLMISTKVASSLFSSYVLDLLTRL
jgi:hypothetical protein